MRTWPHRATRFDSFASLGPRGGWLQHRMYHPGYNFPKLISELAFPTSLEPWLLCAFTPESFRGCPGSGRILSRVQHGGRAERPFKPHHRRCEHSSWLVFAQEQCRGQLQHGHWCRDASSQHRGREYSYRCRGPFKQQHRPKQHRQWSVRPFRQHRRRRQHGCRLEGTL